jgi:hypothetical protein
MPPDDAGGGDDAGADDAGGGDVDSWARAGREARQTMSPPSDERNRGFFTGSPRFMDVRRPTDAGSASIAPSPGPSNSRPGREVR